MDSLCSGYLMVYCIQASELSENVEGEEGPSNEWYELGNKCLELMPWILSETHPNWVGPR